MFARMDAMSCTRSFVVGCPPMQAFEGIRRVRAWWTVNTDGRASAVGAEFTVRSGAVHLTTQRVADAVVGRLMVQRVTRSRSPWLKDAQMTFDITKETVGTRITFSQAGLTPQVECFAQCEKGWNYFIGTSPCELITGCVGKPDTTERTHLDLLGHVRPKNA